MKDSESEFNNKGPQDALLWRMEMARKADGKTIGIKTRVKEGAKDQMEHRVEQMRSMKVDKRKKKK